MVTALRKVEDIRHRCDLPQYIDRYDHRHGDVYECDGCGRYWRVLIGGSYHDWALVGWWESRRLRRQRTRVKRRRR
jgi:hypothetical protein